MLGFIFNHELFDEPYNQSAVKKGFAKLDAYTDELQAKCFYSFGVKRIYFMSPDMSDDYIIVQHSLDLTAEQKQKIAGLLKECVTVKKTVYKEEKPEIFIVFEKKSKEDCYYFEG